MELGIDGQIGNILRHCNYFAFTHLIARKITCKTAGKQDAKIVHPQSEELKECQPYCRKCLLNN